MRRDIVTKDRMVCVSGEAQGSSTGEGKTESLETPGMTGWKVGPQGAGVSTGGKKVGSASRNACSKMLAVREKMGRVIV